jgi:Tfp pilus assembly protein PilO
MKKKLAAVNPKVKLGVVALGLAALGFAGHMFVIAPQGVEAAKLHKQIDAQQTLTFKAKASLRSGQHRPTIQVADLFRLARAMPDREDMPGVILTLSQVARSSGITLNSIGPSPLAADPLAAGSYQTQHIALSIDCDFYSLSDFLYRLRSLVAVHHGKLQSDGRLFNVETVALSVAPGGFPQMSATLSIDAYVYVAPPPPAPAPATPTLPSTDPSLPSGATAAGVAP